jgi:hypothetical protein
VKRSGRDEPIWVVKHMCMEAMLRISPYSYPYLKQAKTLCLSYYCICLLFNKIGEEDRNRFCLEVRSVGGRGREQRVGGRDGPNDVCTFE